MYPAAFEYHDPTTIKDALSLLQQHGDNAKLLAGGHSLIPLMKLRLASPTVIIDLGRVAGLGDIKEEAGALVIGAMTTHHALQSSPLVQAKIPLLAEVAASIGDIQVRNRGTIGGSIAHADPAADWPAALLALDADVQVVGKTPRSIPVSGFFRDLLTTAIEPNEILTSIRVPIPGRGGHAYAKVRQPASGFAMVGIAVQLGIDAKGVCQSAAVGVTGLAAVAYRASTVERLLSGRPLNPDTVGTAAEHVTDGVDALDDLHASSEFRGHLARVHARRAIAAAVNMATR